jgi:starch synthase
VAKAGGLGDVVGALPKYQNEAGHIAKVVMPMYRTKFLYNNEWEVVHQGVTGMGNWWFNYTVIKEKTNQLGFDLYLVDINGLLDRERIYSYDDDTERFTAFQCAVVNWLAQWQHQPDVVHVHDHHTALIPFMMQHCYAYPHLKNIRTVLTIHNAQYQGWMDWAKSIYLPAWDTWKWGLLDWDRTINPLACGVKCADRVTTVSPSYLQELYESANGLEALFRMEQHKCSGILNGIDTQVWNPATDSYLDTHYDTKTVAEGKAANKKILCERFGLEEEKPLIIFIGRLVGEKAADLLPGVIGDSLYYINQQMNFLVLGSGDPKVEWELSQLKYAFSGNYNVEVAYNEKLSHEMYAGADFLLMPSRVEPCGLNQLYALRYGTVPMVRSTGGLRDTVVDYGAPGGYGIRFDRAEVGDITHGVYRAVQLYQDTERMAAIRKQMMELDYSWETSVQQYLDLYGDIG